MAHKVAIAVPNAVVVLPLEANNYSAIVEKALTLLHQAFEPHPEDKKKAGYAKVQLSNLPPL